MAVFFREVVFFQGPIHCFFKYVECIWLSACDMKMLGKFPILYLHACNCTLSLMKNLLYLSLLVFGRNDVCLPFIQIS